MAADVLLAHEVVETSLLKLCVNLLAYARQHDSDALVLAHLAEVGKVVYARRIDERHLAHTYDAHLRTVAERSHNLLKLVACTEEVRTVYLVHLYALRYGDVLYISLADVRLLVYLVHDNLHVRSLRHTLHEEQAGDDESHLDSHGEVEDDGEEEGDEQDGNVALRILHQFKERAPSTHTVRNYHQHTCQTSHRNVLGQRHEEQEDK